MSRKIDALIAEHVMDLETLENPKRYSTDIAAAWEVFRWLIDNKPPRANDYYGEYYLVLNCYSSSDFTCGYECQILYEGNSEHEIHVSGNTEQMAICRAALKAKGIEVDDEI